MITGLMISVPNISERTLVWEVVDPEPGDTTTQIFRSNSPEGPYEGIGSVPVDTTTFTDSDINPHVVYQKFYYKLQLGASEAGPVHVSPATDRISTYIVRLYNRALQRNLGTDCKVYIRRTSGTRCPDCWDGIHGRSVDPDCATCKGTGWEDGYYVSIDTRIAFPEEPDSIIHMPGIGELNPQEVQYPWLTNYPIVHPGDVILRNFDKTFWRVDNPVVRSAKKLYLVRQQLNLTQITRDEVEYTLPT